MSCPRYKLYILAAIASPLMAQPAFEVATIKPSDPDSRAGRYITMQSTHQLIAKNYSVNRLIMAAYNLHPRAVVGGPSWADTDRFDIQAVTPGQGRPSTEEQMAMMRKLLADRFHLSFHREPKELPVYAIVVVKSGPKLAEANTPADKAPPLAISIHPDHVEFPARNATMLDFASVLQRAAMDRPVVDHTGLKGKYDFDLAWTPDDSQFPGLHLAEPVSGPPKPDLFTAIQQQLGLKLEATRASVDIIVIDHVDRPTEN